MPNRTVTVLTVSFYALYEMKIDNGPVVTIQNRVIVDDTRIEGRYAMSVVSATVETGPFDWLNKRLLIGTLQSLRPQRQAVVVRVWQMA